VRNGLFSEADVARTIAVLPEFTAADGLVISTRHRRGA
jgi:hypothetical protein